MYKDIIEVTIDLKNGLETTDGVASVVKQRDNLSHILRCRLKNKDRLVNLKDSQMFLYITKPDGTLVMLRGDTNGKAIGYVDFTLTRQALALEGIIICEIVQLGIDKSTMTFLDFPLKVVKTNVDENVVESSNEFTALSETLTRVNEWDNKFTSDINTIRQKVDNKITEMDNTYGAFSSATNQKVQEIYSSTLKYRIID